MWLIPAAFLPYHPDFRVIKSWAPGRFPNVANFEIEPRNESLKLPSKESLKEHNIMHIKVSVGPDESAHDTVVFPEIRFLSPQGRRAGAYQTYSLLG